jgi:hypothetical protein
LAASCHCLLTAAIQDYSGKQQRLQVPFEQLDLYFMLGIFQTRRRGMVLLDNIQ